MNNAGVMLLDRADSLIDVDDFIRREVDNEAGYVEDESKIWFPDDYVEGIFGVRGSGKSMIMARKLLLGLAAGNSVFTNLTLHPELCGIKGEALPLILEQMVSFDPILNKGVMGIEEIGTWIRRERAMATSTQLLEQFLTQLRKRGLRILFTNQSTRLPQDLWDQVDLVTYAKDMYFTPYGQEWGLRKGTKFIYCHIDKSGLFLGRRGHWFTGLENGQNLWNKYDSYQVQDPLQAFRRVRVTGGDMILDADDGQVYGGNDAALLSEEKRLRRYDTVITRVWRQWSGTLLTRAMVEGAVLDETPDKVRLSVDKIHKMILGLKGKERQRATEAWRDLRILAGGGKLAQWKQGQASIELLKPIGEINNEN